LTKVSLGFIEAPEMQLLADAVARSWRLTTVFISFGNIIVRKALVRATHYRRLLALQGALHGPPTPARTFVNRDGDFALGHRIAGFLLEDEIM
jgi:hypothetical protein